MDDVEIRAPNPPNFRLRQDTHVALTGPSFPVPLLQPPGYTLTHDALKVSTAPAAMSSSTWRQKVHVPNLTPPILPLARSSSALKRDIRAIGAGSHISRHPVRELPGPLSNVQGVLPGMFDLEGHRSYMASKERLSTPVFNDGETPVRSKLDNLSFSSPLANAKVSASTYLDAELSPLIITKKASQCPDSKGRGARGYWDTVLLPSSPFSGPRRLEPSKVSRRNGSFLAVSEDYIQF